MSEVVDVNKGDSLPPLHKSNKNKHSFKRMLSVVIEVMIVLVFAIVFSVASQVVYNFTRYQKLYVNGESMYPTLNRDAKVYDTVNDTYVSGKTYLVGNFSTRNYKYLCDYGLMDSQDGFIDDIERFSIVVTYYNDEMVEQNGVYSPKENSELKVKRVIALPNEGVYFDSLGDLYIKKANDTSYSKIDQPFYNIGSWDDDSKEFLSTVKSQTNEGSTYAYDEAHPYILKDDEYFLVGDNRFEGCSRDSRTVGAINSYSFVGRVVTIIGKCWLWILSDGRSTESIVWDTIKMPWELELL